MKKDRRRSHPALEGKAIKGHIPTEGNKKIKPKTYWSSPSALSIDAD